MMCGDVVEIGGNAGQAADEMLMRSHGADDGWADETTREA